MRFRRRALLGILLVLVVFSSANRENTAAQPSPIDDAQGALSKAFIAVQQADEQGASQEQISILTGSLNLALSDLENASSLLNSNPTVSNTYANKALDQSKSVEAQAIDLTTASRNQLFIRQVVGYSFALGASFFAALFILEFHRIRAFARKMRIGRTTI